MYAVMNPKTTIGNRHYKNEEIVRARQMDLLTYLQLFEPNNLVRVSSNTYCTKEHDSLKISNGKWHWFSRGIGGKSALDYLINVKGYTFQMAVEALIGQAVEIPSAFFEPAKERTPIRFELPQKATVNRNAIRYLQSRGICNELIYFCIQSGRLYEGITQSKDRERTFHNAVFVGFDVSGTPKYACLRGLYTGFKGEAPGSDKRYAFNIPAEKGSGILHLFEAAIDLLSFATLEKQSGGRWHSSHLLSLAGVYESDRKIPVALTQYLSDHTEIEELCLHLDNDEVGKAAARQILNTFSDRYTVIDRPPKIGKDVNDELIKTIQNRKKDDFFR